MFKYLKYSHFFIVFLVKDNCTAAQEDRIFNKSSFSLYLIKPQFLAFYIFIFLTNLSHYEYRKNLLAPIPKLPTSEQDSFILYLGPRHDDSCREAQGLPSSGHCRNEATGP